MHAAKVIGTFVMAGICATQAQPSGEQQAPGLYEEESPFFILHEGERSAGEPAKTWVPATYPRNKGSDDTASKMLSRLFTRVAASVKVGANAAEAGSKLEVTPTDFSLDDRRELTVNFTVANHTKKLLTLEFPSEQRIEIVIRDPEGKVIERWSDDRAFEQKPGVVMINPAERIEYVERVPTREMRPGVAYTIEASLADNPEYTRSVTVTPSGNSKPLSEPGHSP